MYPTIVTNDVYRLRFYNSATGQPTLTGTKGSIGSPTTVNGTPSALGLSASIIGVGTNAVGTTFSEDQAADHVSAVIGGNDSNINVTELEVTTYDETGTTGKHIRYETAAAPVAPDGRVP